MNVCFTADGLRACGLTDNILCTFPTEFREGIATPARSRILGDTEASDPSRWEFGGPGTDPLHALIIIHGRTESELMTACAQQRDLIDQSDRAVAELAIEPQRGVRPGGDYEPFGFRDGISQPRIHGLKGPGVPTGEFILGYLNHYGLIAEGPVVPRALDVSGVLPAHDNPYHRDADLADLGRHGTFVVYRKLQQDVAGFWRFMHDEAARRSAHDVDARAVALAAKCVGRWPSGAPLIEAPTTDTASLERSNAFGYAGDPHGLACPIGAHIRRTHPRDDLKPYSAQQSLSMSEAHRLLRRARVFGTAPVEPESLGRTSRRRDPVHSRRRRAAARHSLLLCERQHQEPVRVRAAKLVQQPALRRAVRQQGSDRRRPRRRRPGARLHGHPERHERRSRWAHSPAS